MRFDEKCKPDLNFCDGCEMWYDEDTIYCTQCLMEIWSINN